MKVSHPVAPPLADIDILLVEDDETLRELLGDILRACLKNVESRGIRRVGEA